MGVNILKYYSSYSYDFSAKPFLYVPCDNTYKSYLLEFWNFKFKKKMKRLKFNIVTNGEMKNCLGNQQ